MAALYQPLKRLATIVTPRWGFVLQLVSIFPKLQSSNYLKQLADLDGVSPNS